MTKPLVMKFGGSSVADAERIRRVRGIVASYKARRPVVVVSALRGVTDDLLNLAREALAGKKPSVSPLSKRHRDLAEDLGVPRDLIDPLIDELGDLLKGIGLIKELTPRTLDYAGSFGERLSATLIAAHFKKEGLAAKFWDAGEAGLLVGGDFGGAAPLPETDARIKAALGKAEEIPVITGFFGRTASGEAATLGRNGSDFSATIFGAALGAEEVQIWSDTDGVMTADPRLVPGAKPLDRLSFEEACELAYYGGKVLHPHTLVPAMRKDIPVRVLNSFKPEHPGTLIVAKLPGRPSGVRSIAFKRRQAIVSVSSPRMAAGHGFLARIFAAFARGGISVNAIATSEVTVSATTDDPRNLDALQAELSPEFEVRVEKDKALVCVVGDGIHETVGVAGQVFSALSEAGVNCLMISQGASRNNIAFCVDNAELEKAVRALHLRFFGA
jgi:aspartate kinase